MFLKGGEKAVSDTKCHIGCDINCRSDATSRAAWICKPAVLLHMCVIFFSVSLKSLSHHSHRCDRFVAAQMCVVWLGELFCHTFLSHSNVTCVFKNI